MNISTINIIQIPIGRAFKVTDIQHEGSKTLIFTKDFKVEFELDYLEKPLVQKYHQNLYLESIGVFEFGGERKVIVRLKNVRSRFFLAIAIRL
jgi:hypothetical protein